MNRQAILLGLVLGVALVGSAYAQTEDGVRSKDAYVRAVVRGYTREAGVRGRAVQVDSIKTRVESAPGSSA